MAENQSASGGEPRRARSLLSIRGLVLLGLTFMVCAMALAVLYEARRTRNDTVASSLRIAFRAAQGRAISEVERLAGPLYSAMLQGREILRQPVVVPGNRESALERLRPIAAMLPGDSRIWLATPAAIVGITQAGTPLPPEDAPDFAHAAWSAPAMTRLTERGGRNLGSAMAYAVEPMDSTGSRPATLVFALATGEPGYTSWVLIETPMAHFLLGLDDLLPTVNGYVTVLLPGGVVLGLTGYTQPAPATLADAAPGAPALAYDLWVREKEPSDAARRIMAEDQPWRAAFITHTLHGGPVLTIGALSPEEDLAGAAALMERRVINVVAMMLVLALAVTFVSGRILRRPLHAITARMNRHDAHEAAYRYWPRSHITEINALMAAIDAYTGHPVPASPGEEAQKLLAAAGNDVPQAQLQALYATRQRLRAFQQRVQTLEAALREIEREQPEALGDAGVGMLHFLAEPEERVLLLAGAEGKIHWCAVSPELQERYETDFADVPGRDVAAFFAARHAQGREDLFLEARDTREPRRAVFAASFPGGSYLVEAEFVPFQRAGETYAVLIALREADEG
jgi:hypothetical protein